MPKQEPIQPTEPDRSPAGLLSTADRIIERKDSGFFVPGSAARLYAEAFRALAREKMKREPED